MPNDISVIMACYNCEKTIDKAIDSILAQTYSNWIMICCDDGSTDDTFHILNEYKKEYPDRFVVLRNDNNMKLSYSLNHCLEYVNTDLVARMDADDVSMPERFERQVAFLDTHPDHILCGTQILIHSELSRQDYISSIEEHPDKYTLYRRTPFNHATIMCRQEMYSILNGYSEANTAVRCEDQELWYRFFAKGLKGANILEPLYTVVENKELIYRITPKNRWNSFITALKGYRLLRYPWYWYYKPFLNIAKVFVPKRLIIKYRMKRNK